MDFKLIGIFNLFEKVSTIQTGKENGRELKDSSIISWVQNHVRHSDKKWGKKNLMLYQYCVYKVLALLAHHS